MVSAAVCTLQIALSTRHARSTHAYSLLRCNAICAECVPPIHPHFTHPPAHMQRRCIQMMEETAWMYPKCCCLLQCLQLSHSSLQAALMRLRLVQSLVSAPQDVLLIRQQPLLGLCMRHYNHYNTIVVTCIVVVLVLLFITIVMNVRWLGSGPARRAVLPAGTAWPEQVIALTSHCTHTPRTACWPTHVAFHCIQAEARAASLSCITQAGVLNTVASVFAWPIRFASSNTLWTVNSS